MKEEGRVYTETRLSPSDPFPLSSPSIADPLGYHSLHLRMNDRLESTQRLFVGKDQSPEASPVYGPPFSEYTRTELLYELLAAELEGLMTEGVDIDYLPATCPENCRSLVLSGTALSRKTEYHLSGSRPNSRPSRR